MWFECLFIVSGIAAVVHGGHAPDKNFLPEVFEDIGRRRAVHPFAFNPGPARPPTYEVEFELLPPPRLPLDGGRETRPRFGQENEDDDRNPTDTNELSDAGENLLSLLFRKDYNNERIAFLKQEQRLEDIRNFYNTGEIRKKRDIDPAEVKGSGTAGKMRKKRTYCQKCGGEGFGGGYPAVPVYSAPQPVYTGGFGGQGGFKPPIYGGHKPPSYGGYKPVYGGGGGCNVCGSHESFGGGLPGGTFSHSSSQSSSSSGSWGYGKK